MTELDNFIISKYGNSPATIQNYKCQYKSIKKFLNKDFSNSTENEILVACYKLSNGNPSNESTYLNLPYMIRVLNNKSVEEIQKRRNELKDFIKKHIEEKKELLNAKIPSYKIIEDYINKLFINKDYKKYIINYLILNYGVRNKDVNCFIINSVKDAIKDNINYLIIKPNSIEWRINEYKTLKTYGAKKIIIKSKKFLEAINSLPINTWLLTGSDLELKDTGLATTLKRALYNNLTEGDYFKIIMKHINTKPNTTQLLEYYSKTRGTSLPTLLEFYDINKKEEINE